MAITREQALAELQRRGVDVNAGMAPQSAPAGVTIEQAKAELIRRGALPGAGPQASPMQAPSRIGDEPLTAKDYAQMQGQEYDQRITVGTRRFLTSGPNPATVGKEDTFVLLNALDQAPVFGKGEHKSLVMQELKNRKIPQEFIETYLRSQNPQSSKQRLVENAPEMIGGALGSAAGAALTRSGPGARIGQTIGTAAGGVLGGLAGLGGKEAFNRKFRPGYATPNDQLKQKAMNQAIMDVAGEFGGIGLTKVLGMKAVRAGATLSDASRLSDELTAAGKKVQPGDIPFELGTAMGKVEAGLTPAQQTANKLVDTVETVLDKSITAQQHMYEKKVLSNMPAFNRWIDDLTTEVTGGLQRNLGPDEMGAILEDTIDGSRRLYHEAAAKLYANVQGDMVDNAPVIQFARNISEKVARGESLGGMPDTQAFINRVAGMSNTLSAQDAAKLRSDLLELGRGFEKSAVGNPDYRSAASVARQMADLVDGEMDAAYSAVSPANRDAWRAANQFWKQGAERFNIKVAQRITRAVADDNPEAAVGIIFRDKGVDRAKKVKSILLGKEGKSAAQIAEDTMTWNDLRHTLLIDTINGAKDAETGVLNPAKFSKKLKDLGDPLLLEAFDPVQLSRIKDIPKMSAMVQKDVKGEGGMLIQILQAGGIAGLFATGHRAESLAALATPAVMARVWTSPTGSRLIRDGVIQISRNGEVVGGVTGQLLAEIIKTRKQMQEEERRVKRLKEQTRVNAVDPWGYGAANPQAGKGQY